MQIQEKAGGIVINQNDKILIVTNITGRITLPKGGLEPGESHRRAAIREVLEESGLKQVQILKELGTIERPGYTEENLSKPSVIKRIKIYLFKTDEYILKPDVGDIKKAEWYDIDKVDQCLTWPEETHFIQQHYAEITAYINKHNS